MRPFSRSFKYRGAVFDLVQIGPGRLVQLLWADTRWCLVELGYVCREGAATMKLSTRYLALSAFRRGRAACFSNLQRYVPREVATLLDLGARRPLSRGRSSF